MTPRPPCLLLLFGLACAPEPDKADTGGRASPSTPPITEDCTNGTDDDLDGLADPEDPDCVEQCSNGIDDDADGAIDCDDTDCDGRCPEDCDDGRDNDGDRATDCDDLDCVCPEVCDNGIDDDADGHIDCADPSCTRVCDEDCTNGIDDDADTQIDCDDPECTCPEVCDDGRDNDRDGLTDCSDPDCDGSCLERCDDGRDNDGDGAIDCDDRDDCATECPESICDDGLDDDGDFLVDCQDSDCLDACDWDDDGVIGTDRGGRDCDDDDPTIYPGAPDLCGDHTDSDCDGFECALDANTDADRMLYGTVYIQRVGRDVAVGDFGPSGERQLLAAASFPPELSPSAVYVLPPWPEAGDIDARGEIVRRTPDRPDGVYTLMTVPDPDGDGRDALAVGCYLDDIDDLAWPGRVLWLGDGLHTDAPLDTQATGSLTGTEAALALGDTMASGVGLLTPGVTALVLGAQKYRVGEGGVWVFDTPVVGEHTLDDRADVILTGEIYTDNVGISVSTADLNGDGLDDLLVAAQCELCNGWVDVFEAPLGPSGPVDALHDVRWTFDAPIASSVTAVSGPYDADGDGAPELAVTDQLRRIFVISPGEPRTGRGEDMAVATYTNSTDDHNTLVVKWTDPVSGDGDGDLVIGSSASGLLSEGRAFIHADPTRGAQDLELDAWRTIVGSGLRHNFGYALTAPGDLDGDGVADLVFSSSGGTPVPDGAEAAGAVWLFSGASL